MTCLECRPSICPFRIHRFYPVSILPTLFLSEDRKMFPLKHQRNYSSAFPSMVLKWRLCVLVVLACQECNALFTPFKLNAQALRTVHKIGKSNICQACLWYNCGDKYSTRVDGLRKELYLVNDLNFENGGCYHAEVVNIQTTRTHPKPIIEAKNLGGSSMKWLSKST